MRFLRALVSLAVLAFLAAPLAGCQMGADPSTVAPSAATYQAAGPSQHYGVSRSTKRALTAPTRVVGCLTDGLAKAITVVGETVRCVGENITPEEILPLILEPSPAAAPCDDVIETTTTTVRRRSAPAAAPRAAPPPPAKAPGCEPVACAGGVCAVPGGGK